MTRAEQVVAAYKMKYMTFTDLLEEADDIANAIDQDWDNESTTFEYADGSVCVFNGSARTITAYGCAD